MIGKCHLLRDVRDVVVTFKLRGIMPAIITHHLFGNALLSRLDEDTFPTRDEYDAFLLGNQGPDPLFYSVFSRNATEVKELGQTMHRQDAARSLDAMREFARTLTGDSRTIASAYLCGFISHFTLDSTAHPLIFAQQYAITSAGIEGLDSDAGSVVHSQIETDIDAALLQRLTGKTIVNWRVNTQTLQATDAVLDVIDKLFRYAAAGVYSVVIPAGEYKRAVKDMRISVAVLYSPLGLKRKAIGTIERLGHAHSLAEALSHRTDVGEISDFDNVERLPWENPYTGEVENESFQDLFERAQDTALDNIGLCVQQAPSFEICGTLNFSGNPHPSEEED